MAKEIKMTRTLTEIRVTYTKANFKTRTFEDVTERVYITDDDITDYGLAKLLDVTPDAITDKRVRKVKAEWNLTDIIRKAKLTTVEAKEGATK